MSSPYVSVYPNQSQPENSKTNPKSKVIVVFVVVIVVAVIGLIIYFISQSDKSGNEPAPVQSHSLEQSVSPVEFVPISTIPQNNVISESPNPQPEQYKLINGFYVANGNYTIQEAIDVCKSLGGDLATTKQLIQSWGHGLHICQYGWTNDYPMPISTSHSNSGGCLLHGRGIDINRNADKATAFCYGPDPDTINQTNVTTFGLTELTGNYTKKYPFTFGNMDYTKQQAIEFCDSIGARLANRADVENAYNNKVVITYPGWIMDGDKPINALQRDDIHWGSLGINEFDANNTYPAMCIFD